VSPETLPAPLVALRQVDLSIAGRRVLEAVDWRVQRGERWGVIGANGSGKTSLLKLIAGELWPAPGRGTRRYDFGAGPLRDAVEARQRVTLIGHELQNRYARSSWNFRAIDVVRSGLTRTDIPRRNPAPADVERARALLAAFGLAALAERRFLTLSRGEQRRVLIARSFAFEPSLLLLDEPTSGLDRAARAALDATLAALGPETTILCSGHTVADLPGVVEDVIALAEGRIAERLDGPARTSPRTVARARSRRASPAIPRAAADRRSQSGGRLPSGRDAAPTGAPLIVVRDANVYLDGRPVLVDLSWQLAAGEHWLVTGPNGAGKSTFLRLLHGQLRPAVGGTIRWPALGDPRNVWELRRRIGFVSAELQAAYRYPTTVRDCVASGFESSHGLTRRLATAERERVDRLLERFELEPLAERLLASLSYGQMHRALLARTLATEPRVLLLDEPWEGLDDATRELVRERLREAVEAGTQIVCISHVDHAALELTHALEIEGGRSVSAGALAGPRESSASARSRA